MSIHPSTLSAVARRIASLTTRVPFVTLLFAPPLLFYRVAKVLVRVEPNDTARSCETTFKVSPSQLFDDLLDEVVLNVSLD